MRQYGLELNLVLLEAQETTTEQTLNVPLQLGRGSSLPGVPSREASPFERASGNGSCLPWFSTLAFFQRRHLRSRAPMKLRSRSRIDPPARPSDVRSNSFHRAQLALLWAGIEGPFFRRFRNLVPG